MTIKRDVLLKWLKAYDFPSKRVTYRAEEVSERFVIFAPTGTTGRVMLPVELIEEWLTAYESGRIKIHQSPRDMRTIVQKDSPWANQLHSFETHLAAIVHRWSTDGIA